MHLASPWQDAGRALWVHRARQVENWKSGKVEKVEK
jgi:hypothetical protein